MWNTPYTSIKNTLTNTNLYQSINIIKSLNEQDIQNGLCPSVLILEGQIDANRLVNSNSQKYTINTNITLFIILENPLSDDTTDITNWSIISNTTKSILSSSMKWELSHIELAERINGKSIYVVDFTYTDEFIS